MTHDNETRNRVLKAALSCQPALVAYAYSMLSNYPAAQDVVQDALVVVTQKYDEFEEGTSMLAWCRTIVRLQALAYIRKHAREQSVEDRILHEAMDAAFATHQTTSDSQMWLNGLRDCLAELSGRSRDLIRLRYEQNAAYSQIGDALGMTLEAVRKSLFRTKQRLASCVQLKAVRESNS